MDSTSTLRRRHSYSVFSRRASTSRHRLFSRPLYSGFSVQSRRGQWDGISREFCLEQAQSIDLRAYALISLAASLSAKASDEYLILSSRWAVVVSKGSDRSTTSSTDAPLPSPRPPTLLAPRPSPEPTLIPTMRWMPKTDSPCSSVRKASESEKLARAGSPSLVGRSFASRSGSPSKQPRKAKIKKEETTRQRNDKPPSSSTTSSSTKAPDHRFSRPTPTSPFRHFASGRHSKEDCPLVGFVELSPRTPSSFPAVRVPRATRLAWVEQLKVPMASSSGISSLVGSSSSDVGSKLCRRSSTGREGRGSASRQGSGERKGRRSRCRSRG